MTNKFCIDSMREIIIGMVAGIALSMLGVALFSLYINNFYSTGISQQGAYTEEAMLCPDGSIVGRTGPHCELSPC